MQSILLNIVHPNGKTYTQIQVPPDWTPTHLLQYLAEQGFMEHGIYWFICRNEKLPVNMRFGQMGLQQGETLHMRKYVPTTRPTFEGRGKRSHLEMTNAEYPVPEPTKKQSAPKPERKGLIGWIASLI